MFFKKSLEDRVEKAKKDSKELNNIIDEYKPFIASTVNDKLGRYVEYGRDDELSIGMLAFKEAIESYDRNKGKFLNFAKHVINLRLIDYYRKNSKYKKIILLNSHDETENESIRNLEKNEAITKHINNEINEIRKYEIIDFKNELLKWNIEFSDLVKVSPKHKNLRNTYKEIAKVIAKNKEILESLLATKRLPINKLTEIYGVHRKKIERGRIYIIALVIAQIGDYEYIKEYIYGGE